MYIEFKPVPPFRFRDEKRGMIYTVDEEDQHKEYLRCKRMYNERVYGDPDLSDEEVKRLDELKKLREFNEFIDHEILMITYFAYLYAEQSSSVEEFKQKIKDRMASKVVSSISRRIGRDQELKNAWQADVTKHFQLYKSLIK